MVTRCWGGGNGELLFKGYKGSALLVSLYPSSSPLTGARDQAWILRLWFFPDRPVPPGKVTSHLLKSFQLLFMFLMALSPVRCVFFLGACGKSQSALQKVWFNPLVSRPMYLWNSVHLLLVKTHSLRPCHAQFCHCRFLHWHQLRWFPSHSRGPLPAPSPGSQLSAFTHDQ